MKIKGAPFREIRDAAKTVGVVALIGDKNEDTGFWQLQLRPYGPKHALWRASDGEYAGRDSPACFHGYEGFIKELLRRAPRAIIDTEMYTYTKETAFDEVQPGVRLEWDKAYGDKYYCRCE